MKIGFTGTRQGMTYTQRKLLSELVLAHGVREFHHGDCQGADEQAHNILSELRRLTRDQINIIIHPPQSAFHRANCRGADEVRPAEAYITRNRNIVDETKILIAAPEGPERLRSGTWSTIRYARNIGRRVVLLPWE